MTGYKIFVDAGIDIDPIYIESDHITVIPMSYIVGGLTLECTAADSEEDIKRLYNKQREGEVTQTLPLKQDDYVQTFEPLIKHGLGILYISMSSQLSNSCNSAISAKRMLESKFGKKLPISIVDSLSATGGIGIIAEKAAYNQYAGLSLEDNTDDILKMKGNVKSWFFVNDLDYLRRGGRTSATKSVIGTLLGIKPILKISEEGKLVQIDKSFGKKKACEVLRDLYLENGGTDEDSPVYITHSDNDEDALRLKKLLIASEPEIELKIRPLSPVIGSHAGPSIIALHHYHS